MNTVKHIQKATFSFEDPFSFGPSKTCQTSISVEEKISNSTEVYVIDYKHTIITPPENFVIDDPSQVIKPCPFAYHSDAIKECYNGVIVVKNEMTTAMVKYLLMEDHDLSNYTGTSDPSAYRNKIMVHITHFWD